MRTIRSFFFGSFAMLAAVMFMCAPAQAFDYEPSLYSVSLEWPDIAPLDVVASAVNYVRIEDVPKPDANAHAATFTKQNQPLTSWRFAVAAYSRIDPHICAA